MKKLMLTTLAAVAMSCAVFAQGYVAWNASPAANVVAVTNTTQYSGLGVYLGGGASTGGGATGVTSGGATQLFYYELMYSTVDTFAPISLTDLADNWTATGLYMTNGPYANGRLEVLNPNAAAPIDNSYTGGNLNLMLVGWSATLGSAFTGANSVLSEFENWDAFTSTSPFDNFFFGESSVGSLAISTSSEASSTVTGSSGIYNPSSNPLELYELPPFIPEPGTSALALLGGASLFLLRRKK